MSRIITTTAVYLDGTLRLQEKLGLKDRTLVQVQISPLESDVEPAPSLFGAFPELTVLARQDLERIRGGIERGLDRGPSLTEGA